MGAVTCCVTEGGQTVPCGHPSAGSADIVVATLEKANVSLPDAEDPQAHSQRVRLQPTQSFDQMGAMGSTLTDEWSHFEEQERRDLKSFDHNLDWLSWVVTQIWPFLNEAICTLLKNNVEPALKEAMPGPLKGVHFTDLSLGDVPPRFGSVRLVRQKVGGVKGHRCTYVNVGHQPSMPSAQEGDQGAVEIEFDVFWDCEPSITLFFMQRLQLGIKHLKLTGQVTMILTPIINTMPVVAGLRMFMLSPPEIDSAFDGLKGLADHPLIASTVRGVVSQKLSDLMVLPNQFFWHWVWGREKEIDVVSCRYLRPIALLRLGVVEARGLTAKDWNLFGKATSDPYAVTRVGTQSGRTSTIFKTLSPKWGEGAYTDFLVYHRREVLYVTVFDHDLATADDLIGCLDPVPLSDLVKKSNNSWWPLVHRDEENSESSGEVRIDLELYDIALGPECFEDRPKKKGGADSVGLLTVQLHCLSGLSKSDSQGAIVRLIREKVVLESQASEFIDPASLHEDYIDPVACQLIRYLHDEKYEASQIAKASGLTVEQVQRVLGNKQEVPFYAHWHQNLHMLLNSLETLVGIEVFVPGQSTDGHSSMTFALNGIFRPSDLLHDGCTVERKLVLSLKPKAKLKSSGTSIFPTGMSIPSLPFRRKAEAVAAPELAHGPLILDVQMDLLGFVPAS